MKATYVGVILKVKYEEKIGSFYIPDQIKSYRGNFAGEVVDVGPDVTADIAVGDMVLFERDEGKKLMDNLIVIHQDYLLAVITRKDE